MRRGILAGLAALFLSGSAFASPQNIVAQSYLVPTLGVGDNSQNAINSAFLRSFLLGGFSPTFGGLIVGASTLLGTGQFRISHLTVVGAGTTQATAASLSAAAPIMTISACAAGAGVELVTVANPNSIQQTIVNNGANACNVYPNTGAAIGVLAVNAPYVLAPNSSINLFSDQASQWRFVSEKAQTQAATDSSDNEATTAYVNLWATANNVVMADGSGNINLTGGVNAAGIYSTNYYGAGGTSAGINIQQNGTVQFTHTTSLSTGAAFTVSTGTSFTVAAGATETHGATATHTGAESFSKLTATGIRFDLVAPAVTAAGTTMATATVLTAQSNVITTCAAGAGVAMPSSGGAFLAEITVRNESANACLLYPHVATAAIGGNGIGAGTVGAGISLAVGARVAVLEATATQDWQ